VGRVVSGCVSLILHGVLSRKGRFENTYEDLREIVKYFKSRYDSPCLIEYVDMSFDHQLTVPPRHLQHLLAWRLKWLLI
jgi:hypothetical protein